MVVVEKHRAIREEVCFMNRHQKHTGQPHEDDVFLHLAKEMTPVVPFGRQTIGRHGQWRIVEFVETLEGATP